MPDCTYLYTRSDYDQQDSSLLPTQLAHFPAGTSSRLSVHFSQMLLARRFQAFDFGVKGNLLRYDQPVPPTIDLARVKPPHALYVARVSVIVSVSAYYPISVQGNDYLCQPGDYNQLVSELPRVVRVHTVDHQDWNHVDFLIGRAAPRYLYHLYAQQLYFYHPQAPL